MKKYGLFFILIVLSALFLDMSSCKKSETCKAGSGGAVTLHLLPQHHNVAITSSSAYRDTAYIKFNATDFPGPNPSNFDMVVPGNANENFVNVPGLKCGQYYIMMTGFDSSATWNIRVVGGLPLNFSETSGSKTVTVAVSE